MQAKDGTKFKDSTFSQSICNKIPRLRWVSIKENALWILRNPINLTSLEKAEVLAVAKKD